MEKQIAKLVFFVIISSILILTAYYFYLQPEKEKYPAIELSTEQNKILDDFAKAMKENEKKIEYLKDSINQQYGYKFHVNGTIKCDSRSLILEVPYYGMSDLNNSFIFSLHQPNKILNIVHLSCVSGTEYLGMADNGDVFHISIVNK